MALNNDLRGKVLALMLTEVNDITSRKDWIDRKKFQINPDPLKCLLYEHVDDSPEMDEIVKQMKELTWDTIISPAMKLIMHIKEHYDYLSPGIRTQVPSYEYSEEMLPGHNVRFCCVYHYFLMAKSNVYMMDYTVNIIKEDDDVFEIELGFVDNTDLM